MPPPQLPPPNEHPLVQRQFIYVSAATANMMRAAGTHMAIPAAAVIFANDTNNNPPPAPAMRADVVAWRQPSVGQRFARMAQNVSRGMWSLGDYVLSARNERQQRPMGHTAQAQQPPAAAAAAPNAADLGPFPGVQRVAGTANGFGAPTDFGPLVIGGGWGPTAAPAEPDPRDTYQRNYEENNYVLETRNAMATRAATPATDREPTAVASAAVTATLPHHSVGSTTTAAPADQTTHSSGSSILNNVAGDSQLGG